jgi:hypothetical protein
MVVRLPYPVRRTLGSTKALVTSGEAQAAAKALEAEPLDLLLVPANDNHPLLLYRRLGDKHPLSHHPLGAKQVHRDPKLRQRQREEHSVMTVRLLLLRHLEWRKLGSVKDLVPAREAEEAADTPEAVTLNRL